MERARESLSVRYQGRVRLLIPRGILWRSSV
jgi:hypothetical protein